MTGDPVSRPNKVGCLAIALLGFFALALCSLPGPPSPPGQTSQTEGPSFPAYPGYDPKDYPDAFEYRGIKWLMMKGRALWDEAPLATRQACLDHVEASMTGTNLYGKDMPWDFFAQLHDCLKDPDRHSFTETDHVQALEITKRIEQRLAMTRDQAAEAGQAEEAKKAEQERQRQKAFQEHVCATEEAQTVEQQAKSTMNWEQSSPELKAFAIARIKAERLWCHPTPPTEPPKFPVFKNWRPGDRFEQENFEATQEAWQRVTSTTVRSICVKEAEIYAPSVVDPGLSPEEAADYIPIFFYNSLWSCLDNHQADAGSAR
jgi:hypothetical protein